MTEIENQSSDDDWNPEHNCKDTIIQKIVVKYSDKQIKKEIEQSNNNIYNPAGLLNYAQSQIQEDDEEDPEQEFISKETKDRYQKQFLDEQIYYDPLQDDKNERWVTKTYSITYQLFMILLDRTENQFDQVLNCPKCFIQLCYDSQKHDSYPNQYRAVFVCNCRVDSNKVVQPQMDKKEQKKQKQKANPMDVFFSVECQQCDTNVAVYEVAKKVYHFFNVLPGLG